MPDISFSVTRESEAQIRAKLLERVEKQKPKWDIKMKEAQTLQHEQLAPDPKNPKSAEDPDKKDWFVQKKDSPYKGQKLKGWSEPVITSRIREDGQEEFTITCHSDCEAI